MRRRTFLALPVSISIAELAQAEFNQAAESVEPQPAATDDRVWLGPDYWANPMEDWRLVNRGAECQSQGGNRNVHLLTHQLTDPQKPFELSVRIKRLESGPREGGAGFRVGVSSEINEYRSNCFAARGIDAGIVGGQLVLGLQRQPITFPAGKTKADLNSYSLTLVGKPQGDKCNLTLIATDGDKSLGEISIRVNPASVLGNVSIVNNFDAKLGNKQGGRFRFDNWTVSGDAFTINDDHRFGPILWSMYSLSDSRSGEGFVLKLSALTGPLGPNDNQTVELLVKQNGNWKSLGSQPLHTDAWTATFRIANWDAGVATPFKLVYLEKQADGSASPHEWTGTIKLNPAGRPLRIGALTCQNDYAFPYEPVATNLLKLDPDMLYFSGDQLYENHGGYGIIRAPAEPAILNYLRKFYQFGWAFGEAMRDRPTICLPDDHDVFQGNIWGEGGEPMNVGDSGASSKGGYVQPARMVNVVHLTNTSHHPDFYSTEPVAQDISVYYGDMVYGGVSFAIIGDRQFKSGPERVETGSGRADHVAEPDFDTSKLDAAGLVLLGDRQEAFLKHWASDWRGHTMKVLLSQTVFAGAATHHGGFSGYLKADLDCGGWPQTPRNNALRILAAAMPLHINGDQHLTSLIQYGIERQRDSFWSFCTPAIAVGYPRWWRGDELGMPYTNRPPHGLANTGEYLDGLGNRMYLYAVGNPAVGTEKNRYKLAHQKGSGFGLVTIDTAKKTYRLEAFRFLVDATDGKAENQFPGWPLVIKQSDNKGQA